MLSPTRRITLLVIALLLFIPIGFLQTQLDRPVLREELRPEK